VTDHAKLKEALHYDPSSGIFTWRITLSPRAMAGSETGKKLSKGYLFVGVFGKIFRAHRLAWFYMTGDWPSHHIDHINGIRSDNRWSNLRLATRSQNACNTGLRANNRSGFKGVSWSNRSRRWAAHIRIHGKSKHIGLFETAEEAHLAYCKAADTLFGEFANHGVR
jgi:hypothetical protein